MTPIQRIHLVVLSYNRPDPDAFIRICAHYREQGKEFSAADCLMVGDSPIDLEFARRCGIDSAFARWGFHDAHELPLKPNYTLAAPAELTRLLFDP